MKIVTYIIFLFLLPFTVAAAEGISEIKIRNNDFKVIKTINAPAELAEANNEWKQLIPIKSLPNTNWTHKIDISSRTIGGRWLYNKEGYVAKLNKRLKPMFKVKNVESFSKVYLGL